MSQTVEIGSNDAPVGALASSTNAVTPPAATRLDAILARVERVISWIDGIVRIWLPSDRNPLAHAGAAANFSLSVAVGSGVALLIWYSPSLQFAYSSVAAMRGGSLGGWVRALHRYSSDLAMLFILVHAGRVFLARKVGGARWLPWISGVGLIALVWFIGWTGFWLVWDQPAQQVAVASMRLLDGLPIFGEPLGRLYVADRLVPSLLFFVVFFLHMLLPLMIAIGLAIHLVRVSRAQLFPKWPVSVALGVGLAVAAVILPAPLDEAARMAVKAPAFTVDAWYLTPLALALRFQHAGLWVALFGATALAASMPWILGRRRPTASFQALVEPARCHACSQCVQDCPFDAITMIPRTDGKRFPSQAYVDPAKCVGCGVCAGSCDSEGISLQWYDTRREEARVENEIRAALAAGAPPWVALVAGDIDSGMALFALTRWRERLRGYLVHSVPTASWVRPKFVEALLRHGVRGVLVIRDARAEAPARDGNQWVSLRLSGGRAPVFRPERAAPEGRWQVLDYNVSRPMEIVQAAAAFRTGTAGGVPTGRRSRWRMTAAALVLGGALGAATLAPSHLRANNPAPATPEFVFSFKVLGELMAGNAPDAAAEAAKPIHMRGRTTEKPQRSAVTIRVIVDGKASERIFRAKGIGHDGPAIDEWRTPVAEGSHEVVVEVIPGAGAQARRWSGTVQAKARQLHVLTYDPTAGFHVE